MTDTNIFPPSLNLKGRAAYAAQVLVQDKEAAIENVAACRKSLEDAISHFDEAKVNHTAIANKVKALSLQIDEENQKLQAELNKAQTSFDLAMKGDNEADQIASAKLLSKAEISAQNARTIGADALRLRSLIAQEAVESAAVNLVEKDIPVATEALNQAIFQEVLVRYDEAIGQALVLSSQLLKANNKCEKKAWLNDFLASAFWISSGYRVVSHLQSPKAGPVMISGLYFKSLLGQFISSEA